MGDFFSISRPPGQDDYFRVNVRPEIVFFSLGSPEESAARFSTWSQPLTLRRMRMWRFVFAALMW